MVQKRKGKRGIIGYRSYMFRSKDPAIDELRTIVGDTYGAINNKTLTATSKDSGVSVNAQRAWFFGDTKRPQSASLEAVGRSCGFKRTWVRTTKRNGHA